VNSKAHRLFYYSLNASFIISILYARSLLLNIIAAAFYVGMAQETPLKLAISRQKSCKITTHLLTHPLNSAVPLQREEWGHNHRHGLLGRSLPFVWQQPSSLLRGQA